MTKAEAGRLGGQKGSHEDKVKSGRLGGQANNGPEKAARMREGKLRRRLALESEIERLGKLLADRDALGDVTRAEIDWLEFAIKARTKRLSHLLKADAIALRLVDWYREAKGWEEEVE